MTIRELMLIYTTTNAVTAFDDGDFESILQENVGAAKTREAGAYDADVWFGVGRLLGHVGEFAGEAGGVEAVEAN